METKQQMTVGVFIALGLIAILSSILLLGGDRAIFTQHVIIRAQLDQVQGLAKGSVVSLGGVNIGNVKSIEFADQGKGMIVNMKIAREFLSRVTQDSTVEVKTQGALGDKYIYLIPGQAGSSPAKEGDLLKTAVSSDLMGILSEKGGEAAKIFEIIGEVTKLMRVINAENRSERLMSNLTDASLHLKETSLEAQKLISEIRGQNPAKLREAIEKMNSILTKIDRGEGTLGALINDSSIHDQIKSYLGASGRKKSIQSLLKSSIDGSKENLSPVPSQSSP